MRKVYPLLLCAALIVSSESQAQTLISVEEKGLVETFFADLFAIQLGLPFSARYDVTYYEVLYTMDNLEGRQDTVSGLLSLPSGAAANGLIFPRLISQHGTSNDKFQVPSRFSIPNQVIDISIIYPTQGYVTLAPDYLGMGSDQEGFHPYVHARTEALAGLRMLQALETDSLFNAITNDQLYLTGYSQGGHASMALHQLLIDDEDFAGEYDITAAAHLSGPYDVSGVMLNEVILRDSIYVPLGFLPYTVLSYQAVYPDLEQDITKIFRAEYVPIVTAFRDGYETAEVGLSAMTRQLATAYVVASGDTTTVAIDDDNNRFPAELYPYKLLTPEFAAKLRTSESPFLDALRDNDTYRFTNPTPTRIYYCSSDNVVPGKNSVVAFDSLQARGATDTQVEDLGNTFDHVGCATPALTKSIRYFNETQDILVGTRRVAGLGVEWRQAQNLLSITTPNEDQRYTFQAIDALGRVVLSQVYRSGEVIDLGVLRSGYVVAHLSDEQGRAASRALVVR